MRPQMVMFFIFVLLVGNFLCLIADGDWFSATDTSEVSTLVGHNVDSSGGIPIFSQVVGFFQMFWKAISWDFSFLEGGLQIIRWFLFVLTIGAVYAMAQEFRGTITSIFGRR